MNHAVIGHGPRKPRLLRPRNRSSVTRAYVELRERASHLKRLALWTIPEEGTDQSELFFHLTGSKRQDIDMVPMVDEVEHARRALD